ncbi:MAG TPA: L-histidine N(alpha)-methyltransferase [Parafilimonas sp.]|nr:L-histidine N(alpha)-methyltransferase [Parafilimonas sp.]
MEFATVSKNTSKFYKDVMHGLRSSPKRLDSKYFYDERGDELFQQIMNCDEYYLTNCEMDILKTQSSNIASTIFNPENNIDVIELGAGDCSKSIYLLKEIFKRDNSFTFFPVDISNHVIDLIETKLPYQIEGLNIFGLNGEYIEMLKKANKISSRRKLVLFMGSNIGNMNYEESIEFCKDVSNCLHKGDYLLIGFDLKKDPQIILNAYNDKKGITRDFNLNLLRRINKELNADFVIENFKHFPVYNPESGECKSYLISTCKQEVFIGDTESIAFDEYETIHTEISTKYSIEQINEIAETTGFEVAEYFYDSKKWFVDVLWKCR